MSIAPSPEIEALVRRWMEAHRGKQGAVLRNLFTEDDELGYLGSAPEEFWGGDTLRDGYAAHVAEIPEYSSKPTLVKAWQRGDAGWAIWVGDVGFPNRPDPQSVRFCFVLALEDGLWRIVFIHNSFAIDNAIITGVDHVAFNALLEAAKSDDALAGVDGAAAIMFTDVAHSTEIADRIGDRAWAIAIGRLLDAQAEAIAEEGGVVVKTLGDGAMASFSSASRALRAAQAIQQMTRASDEDPRLEVRVGVHAGDVIQTKGDFFGSVVNKAARIAAMARPSEILVSEVARAMAGEAAGFQFGEPVSVALRGIEGTHKISSLDWAT